MGLPKKKSLEELGKDFERLREQHDRSIDAWEKARMRREGNQGKVEENNLASQI